MKKTTKRILALSGVILLVLLYVAALVLSLCDFPNADKFFWIAIYATMAVPILLWIGIYLFGKVYHVQTIASAPRPKDLPAEDSSETTE